MKKRKPATKDVDPFDGEEGVDLTLIRWMLSLTPAQRLETLQSGKLRNCVKWPSEYEDS